MLQPEVKWAIKKVKEEEHLKEVPHDIAKQYMAMVLAQRFSEILKIVYPTEDIQIQYIQPFLVVPLFKQLKPYIFELEKLFEEDKDKAFAFFNRPNGDFHLKDSLGQQIRLPHAFSHWTHAATGGLFMITDVQGWKIKSGQYVVTDPIVFSSEQALGLVDNGTPGMDLFLSKHECNEVCKVIPMVPDEIVIKKLKIALERFKSNSLTYAEDMVAIFGNYGKK